MNANQRHQLDRINKRIRVLTIYLALNNTALTRKASGLSYVGEDILRYNTARDYREELKSLRKQEKQIKYGS